MVAKAEQERRAAIIRAEGHAKVMLSLLQDMQENDQRITMLQLVDKMKVKHKDAAYSRSCFGKELDSSDVISVDAHFIIVVKKEEFQHTAYSTNSYVTIGPLAKQVLQGKKIAKLEVSREQKSKGGITKTSKCSLTSSGLQYKLDELRKELSSTWGNISSFGLVNSKDHHAKYSKTEDNRREPWTVPWTAKTILQVIEQVEVEYVPEKAEFDGHLDEEFMKDSPDSLVFTYTQKKMVEGGDGIHYPYFVRLSLPLFSFFPHLPFQLAIPLQPSINPSLPTPIPPNAPSPLYKR
ncbi:Mediator of RNA polymerase II transcription subunit 34 [Camellia lanceoleosa]|uniref:Mediator of RNA polymerase II transcription subunit 34 n=1 Tax=Camellia lanceoleosa TaxID=1840588 RepID=A0ACC0HGJ8_9ERIC|nr:Mediator of RNA polymerase II transcription subunit 34 [Camellia lanceoleosa]